MQLNALTPEQIHQFVTRGWVKVEEAIPRAQAALVQDFLWDKLAERGVLKTDRSTWIKPMEFIAENYNGSPFDECATARLADAISDLIGSGRWMAERETGWWGWWPINFAVGADQPWNVPADEWHYDMLSEGVAVDSPDQGLLVICLFSELQPRGGGTLILEGSHHIGARFLQETPSLPQIEMIQQCVESHPYLRALTGKDLEEGEALPGVDTGNTRGVNASELEVSRIHKVTPRIRKFMNQATVDENGTQLRVVEITGSPGDVILAHPLMLHTPSFNHSGTPRFMCNRKTPLFEPLRFEREDGAYSPLEESFRVALANSLVIR